jgi:G:T/U-mismatch repair DNA glycosylase
MASDVDNHQPQEEKMLPEIWEPNLTVVFVGSVVTTVSDSLGFYHLHQRDRFWELLEMNSITANRIMTPQECKALAEGHAKGSVSDPVRTMFLQKKTSQLLKLGIGLTDLNRRIVVENEKEKSARPTPDDVRELVVRAENLIPRLLAFVMAGDVFVGAFKSLFPAASDIPGRQQFRIGESEVWLLGSTIATMRGEAREKQDDAFRELGERIVVLKGERG